MKFCASQLTFLAIKTHMPSDLLSVIAEYTLEWWQRRVGDKVRESLPALFALFESDRLPAQIDLWCKVAHGWCDSRFRVAAFASSLTGTQARSKTPRSAVNKCS